MSSAQILRLRLRCDQTAPRLARRALERLSEIKPVHDDALLLASELATSAVRDADEGKEIELLAELVPDGLRIAVSNPSPGQGTKDDLEPPGSRGAGQRIVHALARRWGRERVNGEHVWAVLAL
jgi:hypothetical protein